MSYQLLIWKWLRYIETELSEKGVHVITGQSVTAFHDKGQILEAI